MSPSENETTNATKVLREDGRFVDRRSRTHDDASPYHVKIDREDVAPFGDDYDGSLPLSDNARAMLPMLELFLLAVDRAAGTTFGELPGRHGGLHWRMAMTMLTRPYEDSRLAGCIYGLDVLRAHCAELQHIPRDLFTLLLDAQPNLRTLLSSDGTLVDYIPMLADYIKTPEGKAMVARLVGGGDDDA